MSPTEMPVFVVQGREDKLNQLQVCLDRVLAGQPQVVFVTGDAGIGKTMLVREFCRRAQETNDELVVAWGQCSAQLGLGDPYLPFKEILALLSGDVENTFAGQALTDENASRLKRLMGHTGEALVELGPDLVGTFVPGAGLVLRASTFLAKKVGWLEPLRKLVEKPPLRDDFKPEQLFEQFSRVLTQLAEHAPLVVVLDDLHWADTGTLELLFYLSRRAQETEELPLLIIGTYRLAEVKLGREGPRHPLERIINEVQRYWGQVETDLTPTVGGTSGRTFVDALIDTEPNSLDEDFRELLFQRAQGHPLFTVELLRALQERGVLARDMQGRWFVAQPVTFEELPDRVEAVIRERIGRLERGLRDILTCGSVEGEIFTAEVVVQVLRKKRLWLAKRLDEDLEKRHRLVIADGEVTANGQQLHRYRFRHALFQQYLYEGLGSMQREQLHAAVGSALERLYEKRKGEIVGELARHFDAAREPSKAVAYYRQAADRAQNVFANKDALRLYSRALELLSENSDPTLRFELLKGLRRIYRLQGRRDEELSDLVELLQIAKDLGDEARAARVYDWRASYYAGLSDFETAMTEAKEGVTAAHRAGDPRIISRCLTRLASVARWQSDFHTALNAAQEALKTARRANSQDAEADSLTLLGLISYDLGDYRKAETYLKQVLAIRQVLEHESGEFHCRYLLSYVLYAQGNYAAAHLQSEQALTFFRRVGDRGGEAESLNSLAFYHIDVGDYQAALTYYEQALIIQRAIGDRRGEAVSLLNIGLARSELGQYETAQTCLQQALDIGRSIGGRKTEAYALTYLGLVLEGMKQPSRAAEVYSQAVQLRRELGQDAMAMDGIAGLARSALSQSELSSARSRTDELLAWIAQHGTDGIEYPLRVYQTCIRVLRACGEHERARVLVEEAYGLLMERANKVRDSELRRSFLENVRVNREIAEMWVNR